MNDEQARDERGAMDTLGDVATSEEIAYIREVLERRRRENFGAWRYERTFSNEVMANLLATYDRQSANLAAALAVVQWVAGLAPNAGQASCIGCEGMRGVVPGITWNLTPDYEHKPDCPVTQARALLAKIDV